MPELALVYTCGCRETFPVEALRPDWEIEQRSTCVCPLACRDCGEHGRPCPTREALSKDSKAAEFKDITSIPRRRYTRSKR